MTQEHPPVPESLSGPERFYAVRRSRCVFLLACVVPGLLVMAVDCTSRPVKISPLLVFGGAWSLWLLHTFCRSVVVVTRERVGVRRFTGWRRTWIARSDLLGAGMVRDEIVFRRRSDANDVRLPKAELAPDDRSRLLAALAGTWCEPF